MSKRFNSVSRTMVVGATILAACSEDGATSRTPQTVAIAQPVATTTPIVNTDGAPVEKKPAIANVTYTDAESVYRKGHYADALEIFSVYVTENPSSGQGHYMLGLSAWKTGDHERAEAAQARTNLGRVLLERGRAQEALPHIEKAVDMAPESHEVWRVLGNIKSELRRGEEALEAYRMAMVLNERDAWSMNNYGLVLIQLGRYEEALPPLARAVELSPKSAVFQNNLGVALENSGMLGGAKRAFGAAVSADSTYRKAQISLERVQTQLGDSEGEPVDLTEFVRAFVEELTLWKSTRGAVSHGC
jgi:superkiller protein 3